MKQPLPLEGCCTIYGLRLGERRRFGTHIDKPGGTNSHGIPRMGERETRLSLILKNRAFFNLEKKGLSLTLKKKKNFINDLTVCFCKQLRLQKCDGVWTSSERATFTRVIRRNRVRTTICCAMNHFSLTLLLVSRSIRSRSFSFCNPSCVFIATPGFSWLSTRRN